MTLPMTKAENPKARASQRQYGSDHQAHLQGDVPEQTIDLWQEAFRSSERLAECRKIQRLEPNQNGHACKQQRVMVKVTDPIVRGPGSSQIPIAAPNVLVSARTRNPQAQMGLISRIFASLFATESS